MEGVVFIIVQIFFEAQAVLKTGEHHPDIQSREAFRTIAQEQKYFMNYKRE